MSRYQLQHKSNSLRISLFTAVLLLQTNVAIAAPTWMPEYEPGRAVYVDPAMSNHSIAPYTFSPELSDKLSEESEEGLQYYVVAAQQGDEFTSPDIPLGVAAVDRLLPTWTNQPDFPKENYIIIFWVRRNDDLNKGSVGVNAGKIPRQAGVSSSLLSSPNGLVIPALKANMPANPEGAIADIVTNIENRVEEHREAEVRQRKAAEAHKIAQAEQAERDKIAAIARQERIDNFNSQVAIWLERVWHSLPFTGGAAGFGFIVFYRRRRKSTAKKLIDRWRELVDNASTFYYEIEKNELPKIRLLPLNSDPQLKSEYNLLIEGLARFMLLSNAAKDAVEKAISLFESGNFKSAIAALTTETIAVETAPHDIIAAKLDEGINQHSTIAASDLKKRLTADWQSIKDSLKELLEIQSFYLKMNQEDAFSYPQQLCQNFLDSDAANLNYYGLNEGSFNNKISDRVKNLVKEYEDKVSKSKVEFTSNKIYESKKLFTDAKTKLSLAIDLINREIADKKRCEMSYQRIFKLDELGKLINLATNSLAKCKSDFPNENLKYIEQTLNEAIYLKEGLSYQWKSRFIEAYQDKNFSNAYFLLETIERQKKAKERELNKVTKYPEKFQSKKDSLIQKYRQIRAENQALKSRYQIQIGTLFWEENLDTLSRKVSKLETSLKDAQREERWTTNSSHSSSSSSYGSYSSGSDYGSFSGGGDYGGSSGGGDY